jgi:uncharacterized Zn finger protein
VSAGTKPYDPNAKCKVCGHENITQELVTRSFATLRSRKITPYWVRKCGYCRHQWPEACVDGETR